MNAKRTIQDVAHELRQAKERKSKATLLIGAGCSVSAGIPLASGIIAEIKKKHPRAYERALTIAQEKNKYATVPSYGESMKQIGSGPQRDLIRGYIDQAQINWAHVGIASLVDIGCVDRILTTNFDPLVARACAVFNQFPAIYDLTVSDIKRFEDLPDTAVFHLHGQRNGFSLLNETDELEAHKAKLKPLFDHAQAGRVWIVCGYSGASDPLIELIQAHGKYDYSLYWIGREPSPPTHLASLFDEANNRQCFYIQSNSADDFFIQLARQLECFPPSFVNEPLQHMTQLLAQFTKYDLDKDNEPIDLLGEAQSEIIRLQAIAKNTNPSLEQRVKEVLVSEGSLAAMQLADDAGGMQLLSKGLQASVLFYEGVARVVRGENETDHQLKKNHFKVSADLFEKSSNLRQDNDAVYNWGNSLNHLASLSTGDTALELLKTACSKYAQAVELNPRDIQSLNNWGNTLRKLAELYKGEVSEKLRLNACEKYEQAIKIEPTFEIAFYNWGNILVTMSKKGESENALALLQTACEKYSKALEIKSDSYETLDGWAAALMLLTKASVSSEEKLRFTEEAFSKAIQAHAIRPGTGTYNAACAQAYLGNISLCIEWLNICRKSKELPDTAHIDTDADFDSIRNTPEFQAWRSTLDTVAVQNVEEA
jgi:tetratricopeptide (TPR) repeat protein